MKTLTEALYTPDYSNALITAQAVSKQFIDMLTYIVKDTNQGGAFYIVSRELIQASDHVIMQYINGVRLQTPVRAAY